MIKILLSIALVGITLFASEFDDFRSNSANSKSSLFSDDSSDAFDSDDGFFSDEPAKKVVKQERVQVKRRELVKPVVTYREVEPVVHEKVKPVRKPTPQRVEPPVKQEIIAPQRVPHKKLKNIQTPVVAYSAPKTVGNNRVVKVTVSLNRSDYANKNLKHLKNVLMQNAKLEAASQLFGDFIKSKSVVNNGSLVKDLIFAKQGGIIHVKGNPNFSNARAFGAIKVSITAFATQKDMQDMKVHKILLKDFVYSNRNMNVDALRTAAKDAFVVEAIAQKSPSIKEEYNAAKKAKALSTSIKIEKMEFDAEFLAFKMSGYVEYIPIFLRGKNGAGKVSSNVSLNRASLTTYSDSGKIKEFILSYEKNRLKFSKDALKYLKKETQKNMVNFTIHTKLAIPHTVTSDTVTIQANEVREYKNSNCFYRVYLNDSKVKKGKNASINIINDKKLHYVKLSINGRAWKGQYDSFLQVKKRLENLSFEELDTDAKSPLSSFIYKKDKRDMQNGHALLTAYSNSGKVKEFDVIYDGQGLILSKEAYRYFQKESQKHLVTYSIHTKLLIPKEITTDSVTVFANWDDYYKEDYSTYLARINGKRIEYTHSSAVNVLNDNGRRYINLNVDGVVYPKRFQGFNYIAQSLGMVNFMVTDSDDGEKFYALKAKTVSNRANAKIKMKKDFDVSYTGNGILLSKKAFKYIQKKSQSDTVTYEMTIKLAIPKEIKSETVSIQNNGFARGSNDYSEYTATINGVELAQFKPTDVTPLIESSSRKNLKLGYVKDSKVKHTIDGRGRYVTLHIKGRAYKNRFSGFNYLMGALSVLNYSVTDSEDGEKWYALKVKK